MGPGSGKRVSGEMDSFCIPVHFLPAHAYRQRLLDCKQMFIVVLFEMNILLFIFIRSFKREKNTKN